MDEVQANQPFTDGCHDLNVGSSFAVGEPANSGEIRWAPTHGSATLSGMGPDLAPGAYGDAWADIYDEIHRGTIGAPGSAQLDLLASLAQGGRALELGIGTGRVALPLTERGITVEGVDASAEMVARLRAKPGGRDLPVGIADMAEVVPPGPFRLAYIVFNTIFGLLSQDRQVACFATVARALEPGGTFLLECFVPDLRRYERGQAVAVAPAKMGEVCIHASVHDPVDQRVHTSQVMVGPAGVSIRPIEIRYAWPSELDLMATLAGLRLRGRWGGWAHEPFAASSTKHITVYENAACLR